MLTKKQQQGINAFLRRNQAVKRERYVGILKEGGDSFLCDGITGLRFDDLDVSEIPTAPGDGAFVKKYIEQGERKDGQLVEMPAEAELTAFIKSWKKVCTGDARRYPTYCFQVSDNMEIHANAEYIRDVVRIDRTCRWYAQGTAAGFLFKGDHITGVLLPIRPSEKTREHFEQALAEK